MPNVVRRSGALVAVLVVAIATIIALDFPQNTRAQTDEEVAGRIVARRLDDGRVEFGWLPLGGRAFVLPTDRYVPSNATPDGWLNSSPVEVGGEEIGRINANLRGDGRIEFALTPTDGERILTEARYFPTHARPNRWLRSSKITVTVNTPPEAVGSIADVTLDVDGSERVDVSPNFRDADGDRLTYDVDSDSDAVIWSRIGSTVTLEGVSAGSAAVTVTATDPHGASATQSFRVTVGSGPQVPVIDNLNCTPSEPRPEQTVTCTAQLSGGELDRWDWSDSDGGSSGCTRTTWDAQVWECSDSDTLTEDSSESYSTTFSQAGRQTVSLTVRNSAGSDSESITFFVNTPPVAVGSIADVTLEIDGSETVNVGPNFRDADGDRLTYDVDSDSDAVVWSSTGSAVTLEGANTGSATVTVTATDPHGASATQSFGVTTVAGPESPTCEGQLREGGNTLTLRLRSSVYLPFIGVVTVTCTDPDGPDDQLRLSANSDDPDIAYVRGLGGTRTTIRSGTKNGSTTVTFTATDTDGLTGSVAFNVTVLPNRPTIDSVNCTPTSPFVNESVECTVTVSGGAPDTYEWTGGTSVSGSGSSYSTSFSSNDGQPPVSVTVSNAGGSDMRLLTFTVRGHNQPIIDSMTCTPSPAPLNATVTCTAILSGGAPDTYSWGGGVSRGNSAVYETSFSSEGTYRVGLIVSNDNGQHDSGIDVIVADPTVVAPQIDSINCTPSPALPSAIVNCTVSLSGGIPNFYEWSGGYSSNTAGATFSTTFSSGGFKSIGNIRVSLMVRNDGGRDQESTLVRVMEPPTINSLGCPSSATVNQPITCSPTWSGDGAFTYEWSGGDSSGSGGAYWPSWSTPGSKTVSLTVTNEVGSDSASTTVTVVEAPVIDSISCTPSSPKVNDTVTCTASLSGGTPDSYSWSGGASAGSESTYSTSFGTSGSQTVSLTVTNTAGSDSGSASVTVEEEVNQAPECLSISGLSPIALGGRGSARFRCSDPDGSPESISVTVASDDSNIVEASLATGDGVVQIIGTLRSTRLNFRGLGEGSTTIRATATDAEGASTTITFSVTVTAPPAINISCTPSTVATNTSVSCEVSSNSGGAISTYAWSGGPSNGSGASYSPSWSSAGSKTVSLTVSNSAGSDSDSTSVTVMIPPSISSLGCPSSATVNQAISCSPTVTGTEPLTYSWNGGDSDSGQSGSTYSPSWSSAGNKTVSLTVRNAVDSDSGSTTVTVPPRGPVITVSCSPASIDAGDRVRCTVDNSGGSIDTYLWSASHGSPIIGRDEMYEPRFDTAGRYEVTLTASNAGGSDRDTSSRITVTSTVEPPNIDISCTARVIQGNSASCTVDNDGGAISTYSWRRGSSSDSSSSFSPRFISYGRYTVSLWASNAGGRDSDSAHVDVVYATTYMYARCGSDTKVYYFNNSRLGKHWLNMTPRWPDNWVGHLSQARCNSWPDEPTITDDTWDDDWS